MSQQQRHCLGYHEIGDFHYFTTLPEAAKWMGARDTDSFRTPDSFLSLITAVHETYHVMQDVFSGLCCWLWAHNDDVTSKVISFGIPAASSAGLYPPPGDNLIHELVYSSEFTKKLLEQEIRCDPTRRASLASLIDLTGQDLLECHAAILTELHIARLVKENPEAFSQPVMNDLASAFRVDLMGRYALAWKIFREITGRFINFERANSNHPLFPVCRYAAEYTFVAFLLDFAIHIPPDHSGERWDLATAVSAMEDRIPTVRYLKLLYAIHSCFVWNHKKGQPLNLVEEFLYRSLSRDLAKAINVANLVAAAKNRKSTTQLPTVADLLDLPEDAIRRMLNLSAGLNSFQEFEAASNRWHDHFLRHPFTARFSRLYGSRIKALRLRIADPAAFFNVSPMDFYVAAGIPYYYRTEEGLRLTPPLMTITEYMPSEPLDVGLHTFGLRTVHASNSGIEVFETGVSPHSFIDETVSHEILLGLARMQATGNPMRCPLTTNRFEFYPCAAQRETCRGVNRASDLPIHGCMARTVFGSVFAHFTE